MSLGYLLVDALRRVLRVEADGILIWGLSLFGLISVVTILMMLHIVTRGAVLSNPLVVRVTIASLLATALLVRFLRKPSQLEGGGRNRWMYAVPALLVGLGAVLWCLPVFHALPLHFQGDTKIHVIRASQLLIGNSTPATPVTGAVPNDYPYLFHAVLATLAHFTPGSRILHAYSPMTVVLVAGGVLSYYALGRELTQRWTGGVFMSVFASLSGGFGFLVSDGPVLITDIRTPGEASRYLGDFISKRSYNLAFHNLAPAYPRDLTYVLLGGYVLLLVLAIKRRSLALLVGSGIVSGMIGLTGGEAFFVSLGVSAATVVFIGQRRIATGAALFGPALGLYAVWAGPMVVNYLRYEGFSDLSALPVGLPPAAILGSWGLTTLFAAVGLPIWSRRLKGNQYLRILPIALAVPGAILLLTSIGGESLPPGLTTLGRPHRYWPLMYLGVAMFAAVGAAYTVEWLRRVTILAPLVVTLMVIGAAGASPLLASIAYIDRYRPDLFLYGGLVGRRDSLLLELSPQPEGGCSVAVPAYLSRRVPAFTGYRIVYYAGITDDPARIRWPSIDIVPRTKRKGDNKLLVSGRVHPSHLDALIDRYDLDAVVMPPEASFSPAFAGYQKFSGESGEVIVWIEPSCRAGRFHPPDEPAPPIDGARAT
ncbi:MAG: hypothetical protein ACRDKZ_14415 [Actinomycetota bacterium]